MDIKQPGDSTNELMPFKSPDERREEGETLRDAISREAHGRWKPPRDRRDPIDILPEANADRLPQLVPIRFRRMMQSPFAFYRGSAGVMAADLAGTPASGNRVQACGNAHLMNFGIVLILVASIAFVLRLLCGASFNDAYHLLRADLGRDVVLNSAHEARQPGQ
ncbi:MAG: DUF2252 family protein [Reyranella sp.]|nr:DUF2252 family protein [Reyranella sp.]